MKKLLFLAFFAAFSSLFAQKNLPSSQLTKLDGTSIDATELGKTGKWTVVSFWATWCSPSKKELDAISEIYEDWQNEFGVEVIAVSVDDARSAAKIPATLQEKGWPFQVLLDSKQEFQKAMGIATVPHSFLISPEGRVVWEHSGYQSGDELELEEELKKRSQK